MKLIALKDGNKLLPVDGSAITNLNIKQLVENPDGLSENSFLYLDENNNLITIQKTDEFFSASTYSPILIYTYLHPTYGRCVYLDNLVNFFKLLDNVLNLKKISILAYTSNPLITGNVKLDFYINESLVKTQTIPVNATSVIIFDNKVSGELKVVRDFSNENDTLKDGETIVSCIIPSVRITEV